MPNFKFPIKKTLFLIILFLLAFCERVVFDLGPNIELVTMAMILASFYLGGKETFWLVFLIMVVTDRIIGNTSIFLFTWSGFLIPALLVSSFFKKLKLNKVAVGTGLGLTSNLFFYLWTNFGVWLLDSWGMYSKNLSGLIKCYLNGFPFLKNQFTSTLIFVPAGFVLTEIAIIIYKKLQPSSRLAKQSLI